MGRTLDNKNITEHRNELHSMPNGKPKRKRKPTIQEIQTDTSRIEMQINFAGLAGILAVWAAPVMSIIPGPAKIGLSILYLLSSISVE